MTTATTLAQDQLDMLRAVATAAEQGKPVYDTDASWTLTLASRRAYSPGWVQERAQGLIRQGLLEADSAVGPYRVLEEGMEALRRRWPEIYGGYTDRPASQRRFRPRA